MHPLQADAMMMKKKKKMAIGRARSTLSKVAKEEAEAYADEILLHHPIQFQLSMHLVILKALYDGEFYIRSFYVYEGSYNCSDCR